MGDAYTKIGCKAKPGQVRREQPATCWVDLSPDVGKVRNGTAEGENVNCSSNRAVQAEVERSPQEIQGKLDGVKRSSMLRISDQVSQAIVCGITDLCERNSLRINGRHPCSVRTVGSVAHGGIQHCPYWAEYVARRVQRRLLERPVLRLGDARCPAVNLRLSCRM